MSNIKVDYDILNQKQTPAFYASSLATRPAFGFPGRIFIDTDTPSSGIYRDTGSAWVQVADPGAGTTGTLQQVTTNGNTTTLGIQVQGIDINDGAGTGTANSVFGIGSLQSNTTGANNTAIGYTTMQANTTGTNNTAVGVGSLNLNTTGSNNTANGKNALLNNTTGDNNTAVGYESLFTNTTGISNVGIGSGSLSNNTTANYNTAIGVSSLNQNRTASFNTAIGYNSLQANINGTNNTAIGYNSLLNNINNDNTAIGVNSLLSNTSGTSNTAIGLNSLFTNTTGSYNTAIGKYALNGSTTASNNTAIGYNSLQANTSGNNNTAIGLNSLRSNTTGLYNVAIGVASLDANTTGVNNTAIGYSALQYVTIGGGNVAVGYGSGSAITTGNNNYLLGGGQAITTGSNNTIIGSYGGTSTLSNYIVLSDGQSNVRLFANDTGKVGINVPITDTPTGQVDIHTSLTNALVLNGNTTNNAYLGFASAGVNKWRIGNTYNAGANSFDIYNIGTSTTALSFNSTNNNSTFLTSGTNYLTLQSTGATQTIGVQTKSTTRNYFIGSNYSVADNFEIYDITASASRLCILTNGRVGIGQISPGVALSVAGQSEAWQLAVTTASGTSGALIGSPSANVLAFGDWSGNEKVRITSDNNVLFNTNSTSPSNSSSFIFRSGTGAYSGVQQINHSTTNDVGAGYIECYYNSSYIGGISGLTSSSIIFNTTSDYRLKEDLKDYNGLELLSKIKTYDFKWKTDNSRMYGVIAHELQEIVSYAVSGEKDRLDENGKIKSQGVDYSKLVPILIKSIQELNEKLIKNNIN